MSSKGSRQLNNLPFQKLLSENKPQSYKFLESNDVGEIERDRNNIEGLTVRLEPDVAEMFPNSQAANEALHFLILGTTIY